VACGKWRENSDLEGQVATQNTSLQAIIPRGGLCEEAKVTKLIDWDT
jgi:hypothetical protein